MTEKDFKNMVFWGCYNKAMVREINRGCFTGYEVIRPGRINGEPILDESTIYSTDVLDKINSNLNRRAGNIFPSRWVQFIERE